MRRRTLLGVGLVGGAVLAVAGGSLALIGPGRRDGRLSASSRDIFSALAPAVLGSLLPVETAPRRAAIDAQLLRVEAAIQGLPPALQAEVDELLTIAGSAPGRLLLVGLRKSWADAGVEELRDALDAMRNSGLALRQQAYHALRDLTNAGYFADASNWAATGYPGPLEV